MGEAPLQTDSRDISKKTKSSVADILQFALDETNLAIKLLPLHDGLIDANGSQVTDKATPSGNRPGSPRQTFIAWKAAINNEQELWQEAINAANFVIDSCHYTLASDPEEVCTNVLPGGSDEGIFEIKFNYVEANPIPGHQWKNSSRSQFARKTDGETSNTATRMFETTVDKMYPGHFEGMIAEGGIPRRQTSIGPISMTSTQSVKTLNGTLWPRICLPVQIPESKLGNNFAGAKVNSECFACDHIVYRLADLILSGLSVTLA